MSERKKRTERVAEFLATYGVAHAMRRLSADLCTIVDSLSCGEIEAEDLRRGALRCRDGWQRTLVERDRLRVALSELCDEADRIESESTIEWAEQARDLRRSIVSARAALEGKR